MMPQEESKDSRKPKHDLEKLAQGMETESAEPTLPDFMKDAQQLLSLEAKRDKMIDQKTELSKAGNVLELKPGAASGALDKEIDAVQDKVNEVLARYGKDGGAFQVDAYRVGELNDNVADAEAIMRGLEADIKKETNRDAKARLERQLEDATAAWQEARNELAGMKDKYAKKEQDARADLASATEREIDLAVDEIEPAPYFKLEGDAANKPDTVDESLKELYAIEAERVREEKTTPEVSAREATEAETKEVMDAVTDEYLESDEFGKGLDEANEKLKKAQEKKARADAMAARVDAKLNRIDAAQAYADKLRADADAKRGEKRDTLVDDGSVDVDLSELGEGRRDTLVDAEPVMDVDESELLKDEVADDKAEDDFFAGKTERGAVRQGEVNAERAEMAQEAEKLRGQMPEMERQLAKAEAHLDSMLAGHELSAEEKRMLGDEKVVTPGKRVDAFMSQHAKRGLFGKAKGLLGGLFSKKTRELNQAIDLYQSVRDQSNEMADRLGKLEMALNPTEKQKNMSRIAMENRQGR